MCSIFVLKAILQSSATHFHDRLEQGKKCLVCFTYGAGIVNIYNCSLITTTMTIIPIVFFCGFLFVCIVPFSFIPVEYRLSIANRTLNAFLVLYYLWFHSSKQKFRYQQSFF